ncbi:MAG TPA: hypothetical protein VIT45_13590 [Allosphingosinicella sp.]
MNSRIWTLAILATGAATAATALPTAEDHRGNRIEPFRQTPTPYVTDRRTIEDYRNCTEDRLWCADLRREQPEGHWTLHVVARDGVVSREYYYRLPTDLCCGPGRNFGVWNEIVREPRGAALIGLDFGRETGRRGGFRSFQRRLLLLRVPKESGGAPVPVLEAPLSGVVDQPVCISATDQRDRPKDCMDRFDFDTLFTLIPSVAPVEPPNLIMVATASTTPGLRTRIGGRPVRRGPVERTLDDEVRDPACTYTRSFYFDDALGRYVPDAPLPDCSNYLEP